jgi:poly-gamma-glutamate capsule biosynthesis protein CapA/YwtB (metallophosphatase superfamily)
VNGSRGPWWCVLMMAAGPLMSLAQEGSPRGCAETVHSPAVQEVRLIALGDINLGRRLGKMLLSGDTLMPFQKVAESLKTYDIVFANLESNISDQHGRTESRSSNMIFTAPPVAANVLKQGGVTVVSTANNHALDFGIGAQHQTLAYLDSAGIAHCGTALSEDSLFRPAEVAVRGVRFAFFAVTAIMNTTGESWKRHVAPADTSLLFPAMRNARASHDFIVVSYHGGEEYAEAPSAETRAFVESTLAAGADLVVGHHPHVPYGVFEAGGKLGAYSLGNFIFKQPSRFWTQHGLALSVDCVRDSAGSRVAAWRCLPVHVDYQPVFSSTPEELEAVMKRVGTISSVASRKQE